MKMTTLNFVVIACFCLLQSCQPDELTISNGNIEIEIEPGENWLHNFPLIMGFVKQNPPQFAIWAEDTAGNYLSTIFVTYKIATQSWQANNGNRRKECLPHWCHKRGIVYNDGLLLPTAQKPFTDGITGATPKAAKTIMVNTNIEKPFVIKAEFNHSVDFNSYYPENAQPGQINYSGGKQGSGQPAVIYAATVYNNTQNTMLIPIGNSSPDGSSGNVFNDLHKLTSAKNIVKSIKITIK